MNPKLLIPIGILIGLVGCDGVTTDKTGHYGSLSLFSLQPSGEDELTIVPYKYSEQYTTYPDEHAYIFIRLNHVNIQEEIQDDTIRYTSIRWTSFKDTSLFMDVVSFMKNDSITRDLMSNNRLVFEDKDIRNTVDLLYFDRIYYFERYYNDRKYLENKSPFINMFFKINTFKVPASLKTNGKVTMELRFKNRTLKVDDVQ